MKSQHIKTYRKRVKMTQIELAEMLGVHELTLRRWESGLREPRATKIKKLCEVLKVSEAELLNGPQSEKWELQIRIVKDMEEIVTMIAGMPCISNVDLNPAGALVGVGGGWGVWEDDEKFEDLITQIRAARGIVLDAGKKIRKS